MLRLRHDELVESRIEAVWVLYAADCLTLGVAHAEFAGQLPDEYVLLIGNAAFLTIVIPRECAGSTSASKERGDLIQIDG